jgi:hypothetical protein
MARSWILICQQKTEFAAGRDPACIAYGSQIPMFRGKSLMTTLAENKAIAGRLDANWIARGPWRSEGPSRMSTS